MGGSAVLVWWGMGLTTRVLTSHLVWHFKQFRARPWIRLICSHFCWSWVACRGADCLHSGIPGLNLRWSVFQSGNSFKSTSICLVVIACLSVFGRNQLWCGILNLLFSYSLSSLLIWTCFDIGLEIPVFSLKSERISGISHYSWQVLSLGYLHSFIHSLTN